jgi:flagellar basal body-associated protein FliL
MAKKEEAKKTDNKNEADKKSDVQAAAGFGLFTWMVLGAVVIAGATGGFALSQLMGGQEDPAAAAVKPAEQDNSKAFEELLANQNANGAAPWIYDAMEPVLANLDEPGVTRYVRVTVSLEISPEMDQEKGKAFLDQRMMLLRDWLTTYFAGLSLEDVRGSRNLNRIKRDVQDQFNELLFPGTKPFVRQVLFREFAVQ